MGSRVELFEQIRRDRDREDLSMHALARRYGVHRRAVRQALSSPVPPARKRPQGRPAPKLGEYRELIDSWLVADRTAPRKQRHTAKRIYDRLRDEHGVEVSERQVRRYVRERRRALGEAVDEVFVPLIHEPGVEAEVDWGRASVLIAGVMANSRRKERELELQSGAAGCTAIDVQTREASGDARKSGGTLSRPIARRKRFHEKLTQANDYLIGEGDEVAAVRLQLVEQADPV